MKHLPSFASVLCAITAIPFLLACSPKPKYHEGDYLIPSSTSEPTKIVKVVAVSDSNYKVFSHFLSDGKLIQAEDYQNLPRSDVDASYIVVAAPRIEGTFSPDRFISKHANENPKADKH